MSKVASQRVAINGSGLDLAAEIKMQRELQQRIIERLRKALRYKNKVGSDHVLKRALTVGALFVAFNQTCGRIARMERFRRDHLRPVA